MKGKRNNRMTKNGKGNGSRQKRGNFSRLYITWAEGKSLGLRLAKAKDGDKRLETPERAKDQAKDILIQLSMRTDA